jgi:TonB family protein
VSLQYDDFDLQITPLPGGKYRVHLNAPSGQTSGDFLLPFTDVDFGNFLGRIGQVRRGTRRSDGPELNAAKDFGGKLFNAIFSGEMIAQLRSSVEQTLEHDRGLRIRLRLTDAPELADLPWEFLYDSAQNHFLTTSIETPVVRFLDLPQRITPLRASLPLRVLVMIAGPRNLKRLDAEGEWERLQDALGDLLRSGQIVLERLPAATLNALRLRARGTPFHIFHFIGHGGFDQQAQDGVLQFEDETGMSHPVRGELLGMQLHDHRSLRLAVLNACEGARSSRRDPFSGVAQSLLQQRVPAVIAMQFEISDLAAKVFAREFYCAIADGQPVDAAVCESRKALFNEEFGQEWATPVLYMRSHEGTLFELAPAGAASGPPVAVPGSGEHIVADAARKAAELAEAARAADAVRVAEAARIAEAARVAEIAEVAERERAEKERAELARIESAKAHAERRRVEAEKAAAVERDAREAERAAATARDTMAASRETAGNAELIARKPAFPVWQVGAGIVIFGLLFALSWHHLRPHSHSDEENGATATNSSQGAAPQPAAVAPAPTQNSNAANSASSGDSTSSSKHAGSAPVKKARDVARDNDSTPSGDAGASKSANAGNSAGASTAANPAAASGSASGGGTNANSSGASTAPGGAPSSASSANAATPLRVSATDQEAKVIKRVSPVYPAQAAQNHISGMVVLDVVIAKDGTVKSVSPTSGDAALTGSAMDAVKQRRYQPTLVNGQPVEVETTVSVNYSIKDSPSTAPSGGAAAIAGPSSTAGAVSSNSGQPAPCTLGNANFRENGTMIVGNVPYTYSGSAALQTLAVVGFPVGSDKKRIQGVTLAETTLQSASGTASFSMESHPSLNGGGTTGEYVEVVMIVKATGQPLCGKTVPYLRNW